MKGNHRERVAARAYEIWEREGRPPNKEAEHWQRAEQEVAREEGAQQMGGRSDGAAAPDVDTRPAPPLNAAPPLGAAERAPGGAVQNDAAQNDAAQKRPLKKPTRSRRKTADRQQD
jgi:hypothetical protein